MPSAAAPPVLVRVFRDGVCESEHRGHVALAAADGTLVAALGEPSLLTYVRSAAKPFQALAVLELLGGSAGELDEVGLAIACASHAGSSEHQIEAARLLALAQLDEDALRCPEALPADHATLLDQRTPTRLAHNCSGKHAAFLLAGSASGGSPADYLDPRSRVQRLVRDRLGEIARATPAGPGADGCGAPAWRLPLRGLATAFSRLTLASGGALARIRSAMTAHPELVGGAGAPDTELMRHDAGVVAKRGAEAVFAAGWAGGSGLGVAVKIADGGARAASPVIAAALQALGADVPGPVLAPVVLGGGRPHGRVEVDAAVAACAARAAA